ncbi:MFS transporter [Pinirhizobacter sp.]|jgi:MFS family permease|uniref:MFS transporter n=1 Tax=Pinirhizobacter sp. TaxID=2950432 RepID=UPI002F40E7EE
MNQALGQAQRGSSMTRAFAIAWGVSLLFYFLEYAVRSSPAVMMPELVRAFGVPALGVSSILGTYYYTYSTTSLVAGILLDRLGAKYVVPAGMAVLGAGCLVFAVPQVWTGDVGRMLQGAGSAFAFTGAVYLASHGFSAQRLATAIGVTQCLGMLGGTVGQIGVGPLIHGGISLPGYWVGVGVLVLLVGVVLVGLVPREDIPARPKASGGIFSTYKVVFSNPQSYLCGLVAGLLFVPTTIGDMVWGVRFFQEDKLFTYSGAVLAVSMVPFGWVIGCPLLGFLADHWGRRKPALMVGAAVLLLGMIQLVYLPGLIPAWLSLFVMGVASGAAMIPYTLIKEVNPDEVKGSATGAINFLTFTVTAIIGPVFAGHYGKTLGGAGIDLAAHFQHAGLFWVGIIVVALVASVFLRETGHRKI